MEHLFGNSCSCRFFVPVEMITRFPELDHRKKISERLARAGSCLDQQMPFFFDRLFDRLRHLQLTPPKFVRRMRARRAHLPG